MDKKFKTKDQKKIERLEKVIDKQKKELSKVKKDRKRLNYAVGRLESANQKLTINLTVNSSSNTSSTECIYEDKQTEVNIPPKQTEEVQTDIQPSNTEEEEIYTFNVAWIVENVPEDIIQKLLHFYETTGMEKMEVTDFVLNEDETERTISYWMKPGTLECVEVGKRCTNATLKHLFPEYRYHISFYAQRIK